MVVVRSWLRRASGVLLFTVLLGSVASNAVDVDIHVFPVVVFSPASLSFASTMIGATSASQTVTATNIGTTPLNVTSVFVTGSAGGEFSVVTTDCVGSIAANGACQISVVFRPAFAGTRSAVVSVVAAAPGHSYTVALSGSGLNPLSVAFNVPSVTVFCDAAAGASVATVDVAGGDGNPVSLVMSGSADFVLSRTTPPANVKVAAGGIPAADCPSTFTLTVTASQL